MNSTTTNPIQFLQKRIINKDIENKSCENGSIPIARDASLLDN